MSNESWAISWSAEKIMIKEPPGKQLSLRSLQDCLQTHVEKLAGEIGERNIWHPDRLAAAADYIDNQFQSFGYKVNKQSYQARGIPVVNLETEVLGRARSGDIVVIGAHYDSVIGSPGANDNGSGVAGLLEISRYMADKKPERTVRFVAFTNEEPPFFMGREMGSRMYARRCRQRNENIIGMFSLETIGFYSEEPGSQRYPFPLNFFYPNTADFIGFVGNIKSRRFVKKVVTGFRKHSDFPAQSAAAPGWLTGIGWSDHYSFWREGYPALMITDTAFFRYQFYHTGADTPDKLDYARLARVTTGLSSLVKEMVGQKF